jgi:hypothetical protein
VPWILLTLAGGSLVVAGLVAVILLAHEEDLPEDKQPQKRRHVGPPKVRPGPIHPAFLCLPTNFPGGAIQSIIFASRAPRVGLRASVPDNPGRYQFEVYDLQTRQRLCRLISDASFLNHNDLSPDGTRVAFVEVPVEGKGGITVWSVPDRKLLYRHWNPYPPDPDRELAWFAFLDRDRVLTIARDGRYDLFRLGERAPLYTVTRKGKLQRPGISSLALDRDRQVLALANDDGFDLIETATGKLLRRTEPAFQKGDELSTAFSPDGKRLAARVKSHEDKPFRQQHLIFWDVATGKRVARFALASDYDGFGPLVWWGRKHLLLQEDPGTGLVFSLADGRFVRSCAPAPPGRLAESSPDGRLWGIASLPAQDRGQLIAVDLPEGELGRPPQRGPGGALPRWFLRPDGIGTTP